MAGGKGSEVLGKTSGGGLEEVRLAGCEHTPLTALDLAHRLSNVPVADSLVHDRNGTHIVEAAQKPSRPISDLK